MFDVAVVGGGHAGLTAAAYTARAGLSTVLLEASESLGGACRTVEVLPGLVGSIAAVWYGMLRPQIRTELALGLAERALPADAIIVGEHSTSVLGKSTTEDLPAARLLPRAATELDELFFEPSRAARKRLAGAHLRQIAFSSLRDVSAGLAPDDAAAMAVAAVSLTNSATGRAGSAAAAAFMRTAVVGGVRGAWGYVDGGMGAVTDALAVAARRHGAELRTSERVDQVRLASRKYRIRSLSGDIVARNVVLAVHPRVASNVLGLSLDALNSSNRRSYGQSAIVHVELRGIPRLRGIAVEGEDLRRLWLTPTSYCPSLGHIDNALADLRRAAVSRSPIVSLAIPPPVPPTRSEPPFLASAYVQFVRSTATPEAILNRFLSVVDQISPDFRTLVRASRVLGPAELERTLGLVGGHPEHLDMGDAFDRPDWIWSGFEDYEVDDVRWPGLYLAGASTFPGGTVNGVSGRNVASLILARSAQ